MQIEQGITLKVGPVYVAHEVRRIPLSMNARLHWAVRHRWTKAWQAAVEGELWAHKRKLGQLPMAHARITITLCSVRLLDTDNAYAAVKPVVDALTVFGVIEDDRPDCIELVVKQQRVPHKVEETVLLNIERIEDVPRPTGKPDSRDVGGTTKFQRAA
jgi:hypothetical protein